MESIESDAEFDTTVKNLEEWLLANNLDISLNNCVKLIKSENAEEGRCVIALSDLKYDQLLLKFPISLLINFRFAFRDEGLLKFFDNYPKYATDGTFLSRLDALYLFLIAQRFDSSSKMHQFALSIPKSYDAPEYFDNDLIQLLPSYLKHIVEKRIKSLLLKFKKISALLASFYNELQKEKKTVGFRSIETLKNFFSFENFRWAFCSVNSRCFYIEEENICTEYELEKANSYFGNLIDPQNETKSLDDYKTKLESIYEISNNKCCLIPYLDFLNHSNEKMNTIGYFDIDQKCYTWQTLKKDDNENKKQIINSDDLVNELPIVAKNKQVYVAYGQHDNITLLIEYGFILESNPYDKITIDLDEICELIYKNDPDSLNYFWELYLNDKYNLGEDLTFNKTDGPSWKLLKTLSLISSFNKNSKKVKKLFNQENGEQAHANEIKILFLKLLKMKDFELKMSIQKLASSQLASTYHFSLCLNFCRLQLSIVEFNLSLVNNSSRWLKLF